MRILSLVCLLLLAGAAPGAPPRKAEIHPLRVEGETVLIVTKLPFRVVCDAPADLYFWRLPPGWKGTDTGKELTVTEAPQGAATVAVQTLRIDWEAKKTVTAGHTLAVNVGVGPAPPGPPGPNPPGPAPGPAPIPLAGFRVLMVYESADLSKMPAAQQAVLFSKSIRDYMNSKCPVGPDGKTREWRIYDKDVDLTAEAKTWRDAMARPRASVPWIVISTGTSGYEGPLPANAAEALALLQKYGGA